MQHQTYRDETSRAAQEVGGHVVSLSGGYVGVTLTVDGGVLVLALDPDEDRGWTVWTEDSVGERCCGHGEELGPCPAGELLASALQAMASHQHVN